MDDNGKSNGKLASPNGKAQTKRKVNQPILKNGTVAPPLFAQKKVTNRKISTLCPHPKQAIFPDLPPDELRRLAESMKRGLDEPVEILPNGTIISGHQRIKAAKLLGWTEIRCWVRHDLAEQGDDAVERRLIEANFHRRQLGRWRKPAATAGCSTIARPSIRRGRRTRLVSRLAAKPNARPRASNAGDAFSLSVATDMAGAGRPGVVSHLSPPVMPDFSFS